MAKKAMSGSIMVSTRTWDVQTVQTEYLKQIEELIRSAGRPVDGQTLAQRLAQAIAGSAPAPIRGSARVKRYDHRCDYEEGERVFVDNRYGKSFATITRIIRQPPNAFCDKAFLEFDDPEYRSKWEHERSTPYFAINSGRANAQPVYVDAAHSLQSSEARRPVLNATATAKLGKTIDKVLSADARFTRAAHGWHLAGVEQPSILPRPHISAEPGGAGQIPLAQGFYKRPVLDIIDKMGEATIEDIKVNIQSSLRLTQADWETDNTGKIVWIHRLHAAIKHLKRVGAIDSPRREVYRRVGLQRESA